MSFLNYANSQMEFNQTKYPNSSFNLSYRNNKILGSTGLSHMNNSMTTRLPQLSRSFSSSSSKSAKIKLSNIDESLIDINHKIQ
jgi:hypothetical protein